METQRLQIQAAQAVEENGSTSFDTALSKYSEDTADGKACRAALIHRQLAILQKLLPR